MKKFILRSSVFSMFVVLTFFLIISQADGYTDPSYIKFTTPKQENLILGSSRALQGLQPNLIYKKSSIKFYNYAFSIMISPFGKTYLEGIKRKIKESNKKGNFIIEINPWCLVSETKNPNDSLHFREIDLALGNTDVVDKKPNFKYLLNNLKGEYYSVFTRKNSPTFLHNDGWLEVSIPMDSFSNSKRIDEKILFYRQTMLPKMKFSSVRYHYLKEMISYLNNYGNVYLVRLPIDYRMMEIDNELLPIFNSLIEELKPMSKGYLDMTIDNSKYLYTDGNHLYKTSSAKVSAIIADWIKNNP